MPVISIDWRDVLHLPLDAGSNDEPLYERLKQSIRTYVHSEAVAPHAPLPSYRELCDLTGASRITVMRSISDLCDEGVLYTVPGKGTFVADPNRVYQILPFVGMTDEFGQHARQVTSKWLERLYVVASAQLAGLLRTTVGAEIIKLSRVRLIDNTPIALQIAYIPRHICPDLLEREWLDGSLYRTLHQVYGLRLTSAQTTIFARIASAEECALLQTSVPSSLLCTRQLTFCEIGRPIEWAISSFCADRYELSMTHERAFVPGQRERN